jgi:hypothetical protein
MADRKSWDDFDVHYPPNDQILIATEGHPSGEDGIMQVRERGAVDALFVELGLSTAEQVTWWKGIRAYTRENHEIGQIDMQDADHGARWMRLRVDALRGGRLELEKAKAFGVHTGMYSLPFDEMPHGGGTRFTFHWHRDS